MGQWFGYRVKVLFHRRGFLHRHEQCGRGHWAEDQSGALRAISRRIHSFVFHAEFCFGVTEIRLAFAAKPPVSAWALENIIP